MKTIVAGGRDIEDYRLVCQTILEFGEQITLLVSGACKTGVDKDAEFWAFARGIPVKRFPADWKLLGKMAGPIRNREMANFAEALIAIWDGKSRGTKNMIDEARKRGLVVFIKRV